MQAVTLQIEMGDKPKWLPLNFGYNDAMRTGSIEPKFFAKRPKKLE